MTAAAGGAWEGEGAGAMGGEEGGEALGLGEEDLRACATWCKFKSEHVKLTKRHQPWSESANEEDGAQLRAAGVSVASGPWWFFQAPGRFCLAQSVTRKACAVLDITE